MPAFPRFPDFGKGTHSGAPVVHAGGMAHERVVAGLQDEAALVAVAANGIVRGQVGDGDGIPREGNAERQPEMPAPVEAGVDEGIPGIQREPVSVSSREWMAPTLSSTWAISSSV